MKISTGLPLTHTAFAHWHTDDTEVGIVVAKAAFTLSADGTLPQQPPPELTLVDTYEGDPAFTPLVQEQDIAPSKPKTDVIIRGTARSFEGKPRRDWPVSIAIPDVLTYGFHVRGPSFWRKHLRRWQLTQPDAVTEVPLTYALAYGGQCALGDETQFFEQNLSGQGFMTEDAARDVDEWAAPQIGLLAEFMAAKPFDPMTLCGTLPIAKSWLPRRSLAGTFDAAWEQDRHPRMPMDYQLAFWNAAPLRLQVAPYLQGDEAIEITGMSRTRATVNLRLPGAKLALKSAITGDVTQMVLDTVDIDVTHIDDGAATLTLIWRAMVAHREDYEAAEIIRGQS